MKFMMLMIPAVYQGGKKVAPNFVPDPKKMEEWAQRCPAEPGDTIEIRQIFEAADFAKETL